MEGKARDSKLICGSGIDIFTRIKGLILTAIAVELFAAGLKGRFHALACVPFETDNAVLIYKRMSRNRASSTLIRHTGVMTCPRSISLPNNTSNATNHI